MGVRRVVCQRASMRRYVRGELWCRGLRWCQERGRWIEVSWRSARSLREKGHPCVAGLDSVIWRLQAVLRSHFCANKTRGGSAAM